MPSGVEHDDLLSVASLHALAYCERLFYLEEVERCRVADEAVFAGRRLHVELAKEDEGPMERLSFESERLGLRGAVDVLKRRDGQTIPYEHKRGRSAGKKGAREAWATDRLQIGAYALLVEEAVNEPIREGRVRYHADNVTVAVEVNDALRDEVRRAIARAQELRLSVERPRVTENEKLCVRCSLASVCLPEESRLGTDPDFEPVRLLPSHPEGQVLHVMGQGAQVGRSQEMLVIRPLEGEEEKVPIVEVGQLVLHGFAQVSTQALRLCAEKGVGVHWMTAGGGVVGSLAPAAPTAQRHLRQFAALSKPEMSLALSRRLVSAKLEGQLRWLLRATREAQRDPETERSLEVLRQMIRRAEIASDHAELLGCEGNGAAAYFSRFHSLLGEELDSRLRFDGRSRRPPKDRVNAILSYGYGMLYREVLQAVIAVGLHPGVGFYHRPRSAAHTLVLDLMELFRAPLVDMAVVGALNRGTFDAGADFQELPGKILLNESGRRKVIEVIERRKADTWKHSVVGYSLSYARMIELEVRLLEKEWMGEGQLFARFRLR